MFLRIAAAHCREYVLRLSLEQLPLEWLLGRWPDIAPAFQNDAGLRLWRGVICDYDTVSFEGHETDRVPELGW
jgi:hypothetical protein